MKTVIEVIVGRFFVGGLEMYLNINYWFPSLSLKYDQYDQSVSNF